MTIGAELRQARERHGLSVRDISDRTKIRQAVLRAIEDDDFAQRVRASGSSVVCAPRAFVFHQGHASFGTGSVVSDSRRSNAALLAQRWPRYRDEVGAFWVDDHMRNIPDHWHAHARPDGRFFGR